MCLSPLPHNRTGKLETNGVIDLLLKEHARAELLDQAGLAFLALNACHDLCAPCLASISAAGGRFLLDLHQKTIYASVFQGKERRIKREMLDLRRKLYSKLMHRTDAATQPDPMEWSAYTKEIEVKVKKDVLLALKQDQESRQIEHLRRQQQQELERQDMERLRRQRKRQKQAELGLLGEAQEEEAPEPFGVMRPADETGSTLLSDPPTGTMAIVFTDIAASTVLWEADPVIMQAVVAKHNIVIRDLVEALNGYEVKTVGDTFMIAFQNPLHAVRFCNALQVSLLRAAWPTELHHMGTHSPVYQVPETLKQRFTLRAEEEVMQIAQGPGADFFADKEYPSGRIGIVVLQLANAAELAAEHTTVWTDAVALYQQQSPILTVTVNHARTVQIRLESGRHGGYIAKNLGDRFMITFQSVLNAVRFALQADTGLVQSPWPLGLAADRRCGLIMDAKNRFVFNGPRLRAGIHVTEMEPVSDPFMRSATYHGEGVNVATAMCMLSEGGEAILTEEVLVDLQNTNSIDLLGPPLYHHVGEMKGPNRQVVKFISMLSPSSAGRIDQLPNWAHRRAAMERQKSFLLMPVTEGKYRPVLNLNWATCLPPANMQRQLRDLDGVLIKSAKPLQPSGVSGTDAMFQLLWQVLWSSQSIKSLEHLEKMRMQAEDMQTDTEWSTPMVAFRLADFAFLPPVPIPAGQVGEDMVLSRMENMDPLAIGTGHDASPSHKRPKSSIGQKNRSSMKSLYPRLPSSPARSESPNSPSLSGNQSSPNIAATASSPSHSTSCLGEQAQSMYDQEPLPEPPPESPLPTQVGFYKEHLKQARIRAMILQRKSRSNEERAAMLESRLASEQANLIGPALFRAHTLLRTFLGLLSMHLKSLEDPTILMADKEVMDRFLAHIERTGTYIRKKNQRWQDLHAELISLSLDTEAAERGCMDAPRLLERSVPALLLKFWAFFKQHTRKMAHRKPDALLAGPGRGGERQARIAARSGGSTGGAEASTDKTKTKAKTKKKGSANSALSSPNQSSQHITPVSTSPRPSSQSSPDRPVKSTSRFGSTVSRNMPNSSVSQQPNSPRSTSAFRSGSPPVAPAINVAGPSTSNLLSVPPLPLHGVQPPPNDLDPADNGLSARSASSDSLVTPDT
eukprot:gene992-402_t